MSNFPRTAKPEGDKDFILLFQSRRSRNASARVLALQHVPGRGRTRSKNSRVGLLARVAFLENRSGIRRVGDLRRPSHHHRKSARVFAGSAWGVQARPCICQFLPSINMRLGKTNTTLVVPVRRSPVHSTVPRIPKPSLSVSPPSKKGSMKSTWSELFGCFCSAAAVAALAVWSVSWLSTKYGDHNFWSSMISSTCRSAVTGLYDLTDAAARITAVKAPISAK